MMMMMKQETINYIQLGLIAVVIILLVVLIFKKSPEPKIYYSIDTTEIMKKLDSLAKFRDTIKETKTIIKEKLIKEQNEISNTNDIDSLVNLFWKHFGTDRGRYIRHGSSYW